MYALGLAQGHKHMKFTQIVSAYHELPSVQKVWLSRLICHNLQYLGNPVRIEAYISQIASQLSLWSSMCNYRINVRTGGIKSISRVKVWGCVHPVLLPLWKAWIHFCILYYHWNSVVAEGALHKINSPIRYLFVHSHHNRMWHKPRV